MSLLRLFKRQTGFLMPSGAGLRRGQDRLLHRLGLRRTRDPLPLITDPKLTYGSVLPLAISDALHDQPDFTFLQIGAYDGLAHDDLHGVIARHALRGVLVEPHPSAFSRLKSLHGDDRRLTLLNAAIDHRAGTRELYSPPRADTQLASFDPSHVMRAGFGRDELNTHQVDCLTIDDALRLGGLQEVDLLHINAGGHDHEILASLDLDRVRPSLIRFEHRFAPRGELNACLARLSRYGYRFHAEPHSVIAIGKRRRAAPALRLAA
ncbi:hypothetical protein Pla123a_09470 [Posidoniimonas polymericola]|uniref:Methyltransferase FkbM domain-containing protein n=1 Tax=Posidoniimonas polymericola TaxID=2528002 RepID=A0A5C5YU63_9BACT|nr:FkbM family methyltransferase [Posidoniimonas polymericola]TWT78157.1 hypothetical protein Pla123a_09470 [Posidoniimonas polymericola]